MTDTVTTEGRRLSRYPRWELTIRVQLDDTATEASLHTEVWAGARCLYLWEQRHQLSGGELEPDVQAKAVARLLHVFSEACRVGCWAQRPLRRKLRQLQQVAALDDPPDQS
jgi:hypothetical protein